MQDPGFHPQLFKKVNKDSNLREIYTEHPALISREG